MSLDDCNEILSTPVVLLCSVHWSVALLSTLFNAVMTNGYWCPCCILVMV